MMNLVNMPTLKRGAAMPLYHQLKASLLRDIEEGRWRAGEQLPTEDALMTRFHVSKITVRQALRDLAQLGYIRREQGRGTFVQGAPLEEGPRELKSFTDEVRGHGLTASSQVLEQGVTPATGEVAERLAIAEGAPVFCLRRLRLADAEPMGIQAAYVPGDLVPGIERVPFSGASLYEVFASKYSLYPSSARETHQAALVHEEIAALLRVPVGSPALKAERITTLPTGRILEYVASVMRGDRYKIVLDLAKPSF